MDGIAVRACVDFGISRQAISRFQDEDQRLRRFQTPGVELHDFVVLHGLSLPEGVATRVDAGQSAGALEYPVGRDGP